MDDFDVMRGRAARRKSAWNLLLIPAVIIPLGLLLWRTYLLIELLHMVFYRGETLDRAHGVGPILVAVAPFIGMLPVAMLIGNVLVWLVPPARRALDGEAVPHPGTAFREAQRGLLTFAWYVMPPSLVLTIIGTLLPWY